MGAASDSPHEGTQRHTVLVLKSQDYDRTAAENRGELPYRIDLLGDGGIDLVWTEGHRTGRLGRGRVGNLVRRSEALVTPWAQLWAARRLRRDADATIAIFESEGHGLAAVRRLRRTARRPDPQPFVIIACWLADLAKDGSKRRRRLYRWLYGAVDRVVVFSANQAETLRSLVGIDPDRIEVVRFGIDLDELRDVTAPDSGKVVAAGRDLGRDWVTLAAAARGSGWDVELITRPSQVATLDLPPEVTVAGVVDRDAYLAALAGAAVVVVPTEVREYPTGQTVLLEAMALGKACVVTDTPAMATYIEDGRTAILVPPHDAAALRAAVDALLADPARRAEIGAAARADAEHHGGAAKMWAEIATVIGH